MSAGELSLRTPANLTRAVTRLMSDFQAARPARWRRERTGLGGTADDHYTQSELATIREQCRDMERNDGAIAPMFSIATNNTIGADGMQYEPRTGDAEIDAELSERFAEWSNDPDACDQSRRNTFAQIQRIAFRAMLRDGDAFAVFRKNGRIHTVEADQVATPTTTRRRVVHGVRLDAYDAPVEYWIAKKRLRNTRAKLLVRDVQPVARIDSTYEIPIAQVAHVFAPWRFSQTRGYPVLATVFDRISILDDLELAKLIQAQVASIVGLWIEQSGEDDRPLGGLGRRSEDTADPSRPPIEELTPGLIHYGAAGQTPHVISGGIPNPEYFPHVKQIVRTIALNVGLPLVVAWMDASETNYTGFRGAKNEARLGFRANQAEFKRRLLSPLVPWLVAYWRSLPRLRGGLSDRARRASIAQLIRHRWHAPTWPYIDPHKDAAADVVRRENILESPRSIAGERGREWPDIVAETIEDNGTLIEAAIARAEQLRERFPGVAIDWRDVLFPTRANPGAADKMAALIQNDEREA
jgi:lambda family phage portal protein